MHTCCITTPHVSGHSPKERDRMTVLLNVKNHIRKKPVLHLRQSMFFKN